MVKRIILFLLQLLAFFALLLGGYWDFVHLFLAMRYPAWNVIPLWKFHLNANYDFIANGLIFASILFILILLFEAMRKALRPWAALTTAAFVLAVIASFIAKLGLVRMQP